MPLVAPITDPTDLQDTLIADAWRLAAEALYSGTLTLADGDKTIKLDPRDMLRHVQWLAALGKRKPKTFQLPKGREFVKPTE